MKEGCEKKGRAPRERVYAISARALAVTAGLALTAGLLSGAAVVYGISESSASDGARSIEQASGEPSATERSTGVGCDAADTPSFDYTGGYAGQIVAKGEKVTSTDETYETKASDEVGALALDAGTLSLTGDAITKTGDDADAERCSFYGVNSVLTCAGDRSKAVVQDTSLSSASEGSNAIFAADDASVLARDVTIATQAAGSRGINATYGGSVIADRTTITTSGDCSAGIATGRGGGTVNATRSSVSTRGSDSPVLCSVGDVEVSDLTGSAQNSQIATLEGAGTTVLIKDSSLSSATADKTGSDPIADGVLIYQTASGDTKRDAETGAMFQASSSTLKSSIRSGAMFHVTNTYANMVLSSTKLDFDSDCAELLRVSGNDVPGWGKHGENGGRALFTARDEQLKGTISVDSTSAAYIALLDGSSWTGDCESVDGGGGAHASVRMGVDGTSTWVVTKSCAISALDIASGGRIVDEQGRQVSIIADGKTVISGPSDVTITVTGTISDSVELGPLSSLADSTSDRSPFDKTFGTDTAWDM